jgi:hypothetical protein
MSRRDHCTKRDCTWIILSIIFGVVGLLYVSHMMIMALASA